jgi:hypothetical protein
MILLRKEAIKMPKGRKKRNVHKKKRKIPLTKTQLLGKAFRELAKAIFVSYFTTALIKLTVYFWSR